MEDRFNQQSTLRVVKWLDSYNKPTWMKGHPVAVSLVALLLAHNAEEHPWIVTHNTLSQSCGCGLTHIKTEIDQLEAKGWLSKTGVKGEVKGFSLIDAADGYSKYLGTPEIQITPEAKVFATWYRSIQQQYWSEVSKRNKREAAKKILEKGRQVNAAHIIQHAGSLDRAKEMATYAMASPKYRKRALQTPYNLRMVLSQKSFIDDFESGAPAIPVTNSGAPSLPQGFVDRAKERGWTAQLGPLEVLRGRLLKLKQNGASKDECTDARLELMRAAQELGVQPGAEWGVVIGLEAQ
jgi:hypothetical protein